MHFQFKQKTKEFFGKQYQIIQVFLETSYNQSKLTLETHYRNKEYIYHIMISLTSSPHKACIYIVRHVSQ